MVELDPDTPVTMSAARRRLHSLIGSEALSESQVGEAAVAIDLILSQGSADPFAALKLVRELLEGGSSTPRYDAIPEAPLFNLATTVVVEGTGSLTAGHGRVDFELDEALQDGPALPRYLKIETAPPGTTALLIAHARRLFPAAMPVDEVLNRWAPLTPLEEWHPWRAHRGVAAGLHFQGPREGPLVARIALEFVEEPVTLGGYSGVPTMPRWPGRR